MSFFDKFYSYLSFESPLTYIDIGAMGGLCSYWQKLADRCRVITFEPDEREYKKLKSTSQITHLPYVLYHSSQPVKFYISRDSGKSSIYPPNMSFLKDFPDVQRYETVQEKIFPQERVKTLDDALHGSGIKDADFLKIDTQGSELDILKGATGILNRLCGVEVEVEFAPLYQGQALFREVDAFLVSKGFELIDLRRATWKRKSFSDYVGRGQLVFGDALYLRKSEDFLNTLAFEKNSSKVMEIIAKAVLVAMVYKLPDYSIDLLDKALVKGLISSSQHQLWGKEIRDEASSWGVPHLWGRALLAKVLNRLSEGIKPKSHLGWSDGDRFIGNIRNI